MKTSRICSYESVVRAVTKMRILIRISVKVIHHEYCLQHYLSSLSAVITGGCKGGHSVIRHFLAYLDSIKQKVILFRVVMFFEEANNYQTYIIFIDLIQKFKN